MIDLVLADAELETVPEAIRDHPQVTADARKRDLDPAAMLLDSSRHHAAMQDLPEGDRRGRADIVHLALLVALESRAAKAGRVRPWVHTRDDRLVTVDPETRLPKQLHRFTGLMRQLLSSGRVGPKDRDLMVTEPDRSLAEVVADRGDPVVVMDADGEPATQDGIVEAVGDGTVVVGAFPSGGYRSDLPDAPRLALGGEPLMAWAVAGEVVAGIARRRIDG